MLAPWAHSVDPDAPWLPWDTDTKVWSGTPRKGKCPSLVWMLMAPKLKLNVFYTGYFSNRFLIYSVQQSKLATHKVTATLL